jgi:iron complex outermembrane receptor protein
MTKFMLRSGTMLLGAFASSAYAQGVPPGQAAEPASAPPAEPSEGVADIVVYGTKNAKADSLQKVPAAITALNADALETPQFRSVVDVGRIAPNVALQPASTLPGVANFMIRGIGLNGTVKSIDPAVNLVVDGMVYAFPVAAIVDTFDVESVEILRGPQGILFGRNATGGAVSFRSRRPGNNFDAAGSVAIGNNDQFDVTARIEGPIVQDRLFAKLAVLRRTNDGPFRDRNTGTFVPAPANPTGTDTSSMVDQLHQTTFLLRPTIVWQPTDNLDITLLGEYGTIKGGGPMAQTPNPNPILRNVFGYTPNLGRFEINQNLPGKQDASTYRAIAEVNLDIGIGVISSITGWRRVNYAFSLDADGTPFTLFHFPDGNKDKSTQFSEELRFASTFSDSVRLIAGVYYNDLDIATTERRQFTTLLSPAATTHAVVHQQGFFDQRAEAAAAFGNVEWSVLPNLKISAGGRYSWERKDIEVSVLRVCPGASFDNCLAPPVSLSKSWSDFSPRAGIEYQATDDTLLYATWTNGFRSGNFNARAQNIGQIGPADPETAEAFELGLKTSFWDNKARINIALFRTNYDDIQRTIIVGAVQTLANAASAKIDGAEVELTLKPTRGLTLSASGGYTNGRYVSFNGLDLTGDGIADPDLAKRLKFDRVPKWTAFVSADYGFDIDAIDSRMNLQASYAYKSSFFTDVPNTPSLAQDAYGLIDSSISLEHGQWRATAFVRNLTNVRYIDFGSTFTFGPELYYSRPRTYGLELSFRY